MNFVFDGIQLILAAPTALRAARYGGAFRAASDQDEAGGGGSRGKQYFRCVSGRRVERKCHG